MPLPSTTTLRHFSLLAVLTCAMPALAADVALAGLLAGRAVVVVNGGNPRTLSVGGKAVEGVRLLAVEPGAAVFEIDGRKQRLVLGDHVASSGGSDGGGASATLTSDARGQFFAQGSVNGAPVRFMVDTGASFVSLNAADATRARIDYRGRGQPVAMSTANGVIQSWRVPGNTVRLGDITLHEVDVVVSEAAMPMVLLGMSFLNRMEMKRDGDTMTLRKRY